MLIFCKRAGSSRALNRNKVRNMKYPLSFLLVELLAFGVSAGGGPSNVKPVDVDPSSVATEDDYVFNELSDGTYEIVAKASFDKSVVRIPSSVTRIEIVAFGFYGQASPFGLRVHGDMSGYADDWCPMGASLILA